MRKKRFSGIRLVVILLLVPVMIATTWMSSWAADEKLIRILEEKRLLTREEAGQLIREYQEEQKRNRQR